MAMPEMAHPAWAKAHCPNQAPGWPCKTSWSRLLKNESHAIGGAAVSSQWQMWATARGDPLFHIDKVPCLLSCILHDGPRADLYAGDPFAPMHAILQSSAVPLSKLLTNAGAEKQCSGFCTCAISAPITFGEAPAQASQDLL